MSKSIKMMVALFLMSLCINDLLGSLICLTMTRLDVAHVLQVVSQFVGQPSKCHLMPSIMFFNIFAVLLIKDFYIPCLLRFCAYADADWASCPDSHFSDTW